MAEESKRSVEQQEWATFEVLPPMIESLEANGMKHPTEVQARSLVFL